uniref:Protein strawberry notch homolog 1 n=1 Tax=Phallusia mammillata TaxID=59560 RepID=A0A6F9DS97_9ASCI|nr:protein strawberry notch homolog 1 [Phallusia mammillata]
MEESSDGLDLLSAALNQSGLMNFDLNTPADDTNIDSKEQKDPLLDALGFIPSSTTINTTPVATTTSVEKAKPPQTTVVKKIPINTIAKPPPGVKIIKIPALKAGSIIKINKLGGANIIKPVSGNLKPTTTSAELRTTPETSSVKLVTQTSSNGIKNITISANTASPVQKFVASGRPITVPLSVSSTKNPSISVPRTVITGAQLVSRYSDLPLCNTALKKSQSVPVFTVKSNVGAPNGMHTTAVKNNAPKAGGLNLGSLFVETVEKSVDSDFDTPPGSPFAMVMPEKQPTEKKVVISSNTFYQPSPLSSLKFKTVLNGSNSPVHSPSAKIITKARPEKVHYIGRESLLRSFSVPTMTKKEGEDLVEEEEREEESGMKHTQTYAEYMPSKLNIGLPHPDSVVETSSLASITPPDVRYRLSIPQDTIDMGQLSALQLESIVYASQKHCVFLPNGERAGYFIGDGAGVGKGRTVAGVIYENYLAGRKRALWFSVSNDLKYDAERDLRDIGARNIKVYALNKFKYGKITAKNNGAVKKGVIFATYSSLIGESHSQAKYHTRFKQILHWCGEDFDGPIIFDECHKAKNLLPSGSGKSTKTGATVLLLQNQLPKARVVYASATGASEPRNMAYMSRLGLWGQGTSFPVFSDFIQAVERRGVGAMELVAMDMKMRGSYIARQLSFYGVSFHIEEVPLSNSFTQTYNKAVRLWVTAREAFQAAAALLDAEYHMRKTMWAQFWSAHQRFFKYLCISAKVGHTVSLVREAVKHGKCVVIGLQSTGEAGTVDQLEKCGGELDDFVSTAKNVFENLILKHFPAPDRQRVAEMFGEDFYKRSDAERAQAGRRKRVANIKPAAPTKRQRRDSGSSVDDASSTSESATEGANAGSASDESDDDDLADFSADSMITSDEDIGKIFGFNQSDSDEAASPIKRKKRTKKRSKSSTKKSSKVNQTNDGFNMKESLEEPEVTNEKPEKRGGLLDSLDLVSGTLTSDLPGMGAVERAQALKRELLERLEKLGSYLPNNMLDELIDALGGPDNVAEMTGRKGRVIATDEGNVEYQSRAESDVPVELLNLTEKQRFMDGDKNIAIISEAASSGISLQSDKRARNQRRRMHVTLELPWSADRAIQQFGRTHRSNQVNAPEYVFMITELAGEQRFASVVAKRLECLGALTHGDRRATESRDLSQYNYDNKYGRRALDSIMRSIAGYEAPIVPPPSDYSGNFFRDARQALLGVGLLNRESGHHLFQLDKDYNNIFKFMNRMLGMEVEHQNGIFAFFRDTLKAIIQEAKQAGQYDQGIVDLGAGSDNVERVRSRDFQVTSSCHVSLHTVKIERGTTWTEAVRIFDECATGDDSGFYVTLQKSGTRHMTVLAIEATSKRHRTRRSFTIYRPNTGKQNRRESVDELYTKYTRVQADEAEEWWKKQYEASLDHCSHQFWQGNCRRGTCNVGKRRRTYHVLGGSVLSVWKVVESVLMSQEGANYKMQIVRLKSNDGQKLVGVLIPSPCVPGLVVALTRQVTAAEQTEQQQQAVTSSWPQAGAVQYISSDEDDLVDYEEVEEEMDPDAVLSSVLAPKQQYSWTA